MNKEELIKALTDVGVQFPTSATIQQLRKLYAEYLRENGSSNLNVDIEESENVVSNFEEEQALDVELRIGKTQKMCPAAERIGRVGNR